MNARRARAFRPSRGMVFRATRDWPICTWSERPRRQRHRGRARRTHLLADAHLLDRTAKAARVVLLKKHFLARTCGQRTTPIGRLPARAG